VKGKNTSIDLDILITWFVLHVWSSLQLSLLSKVLPSPTPGANKRKAEDSKGKGSAKKPSAGAAKKGVFKR